jgi:hypothetical protein
MKQGRARAAEARPARRGNAFRSLHVRELRLAQIKARARPGGVVVKGGRRRQISSGDTTRPCPNCGCPVVWSAAGRRAHGQRQERCQEAMQ